MDQQERITNISKYVYVAIAEREKGGQPSKEKEKKTNNTFEINNFAAVEINEAAGKKNLKGLKVRVCGL